MRKYSYIAALMILGSFLYAQEGLRPLSANMNYFYPDLRPELAPRPGTTVSNQRPAAISLSLPFQDDFSYCSFSAYPDQSKWEDSLVYVNWGMPIAPLSFGVATFDGLNKHGYPYNPTLVNSTLSFPADTLTSRPINLYTSGAQTLTPNSEVALSFFYQARGNGDPPDQNDSLILDLFRPLAPPDTAKGDTAWKKRVWFVEGSSNSNLNDTIFKYVFVRVQDSSYFHDGFKFRFRSTGSVTGNFDHWHLDYLVLDKNRSDSLIDTARKDLTFAGLPTQFLREYSEMPHQQYIDAEMGARFNNRIRNNGADPKGENMNYRYRIFNQFGAPIFAEYPGSLENLYPFWKLGYDTAWHHSRPPITNTFVVQGINSVFFPIKHYVFIADGNGNGTGAKDQTPENDTLVQYQYFRNFYAFDDGTAEAGYYVNKALAKIAVKTRLNVADSLLGLQIYFDPVGNVGAITNTASTVYNFTINVWEASSSGGPSTILKYKDSITYHPQYLQTGFKTVPEYRLKRPLILQPGTYYIGIQQASSILTFGFDRNYNHNTGLYFDSGSGWTQSQEYGSIMMHPVFRTYVPPLVGIEELSEEKNSFKVYPNPSSEQFMIVSSAEKPASYELYNTLGQLVKQELSESASHTVNTSSFEPGLYVLIIKTKGRAVQQQKIIVQH